MSAISVDGESINYRVRRSRRAKHGRILVGADGVEVVVPAGVTQCRVQEWVYARRHWVLAKRAEFEQCRQRARPYCAQSLDSGSQLLYGGVPVTLSVERARLVRPGAHVNLRGSCLHVLFTPQPKQTQTDAVSRAVEAWMRRQLRRRAEAMLGKHAERLGVAPAALRIKTQRRRWGSCGATGIINLNWRLAMAPDTVVAYVLVHELCHLVHRNHSRAFWQLVARECPDFSAHKQWLDDHHLILTASLSTSS